MTSKVWTWTLILLLTILQVSTFSISKDLKVIDLFAIIDLCSRIFCDSNSTHFSTLKAMCLILLTFIPFLCSHFLCASKLILFTASFFFHSRTFTSVLHKIRFAMFYQLLYLEKV